MGKLRPLPIREYTIKLPLSEHELSLLEDLCRDRDVEEVAVLREGLYLLHSTTQRLREAGLFTESVQPGD